MPVPILSLTPRDSSWALNCACPPGRGAEVLSNLESDVADYIDSCDNRGRALRSRFVRIVMRHSDRRRPGSGGHTMRPVIVMFALSLAPIIGGCSKPTVPAVETLSASEDSEPVVNMPLEVKWPGRPALSR